MPISTNVPAGTITPAGQSRPQALNTLTAQQQSWMRPQDWDQYNQANASGASYMAPQQAPQNFLDTALGSARNSDGSVLGSWAGSGTGLDSSYYNADRTGYAPDARARIAANNQLDQVGVANTGMTYTTPEQGSGLIGGVPQQASAQGALGSYNAPQRAQSNYAAPQQVQGGQGAMGGQVGNMGGQGPQQGGQGAMGNMGAYGPPNSQVALNSGFGSVQGVTDAMMSRLQPQMDRARQTEINRLKAQGIPENSAAWGSAMDTLNRSDVDARNQGLLAGTAENNNIFNRGLAQNNQVYGQNLQNQQYASSNNQQSFNQRLAEQQLASQNANNQGQLQIQQRQQAQSEANNPYQQMMWMNSMQQGNPVFGNFTNAGLGGSTDYSQAGKDTYQGLLGNYNAETAGNAAKIGGIGQLVGGIGSSLINSPNAVSNIGSNIGGLVGGIGNAAKTIGGWFSGD